LTDLDEHPTGGRLELVGELADPLQGTVGESCEQRDRPQLLDVHAGRTLHDEAATGSSLEEASDEGASGVR